MLSVILLMIVVVGLATLAVSSAVRNTHGAGLSRAKLQAADGAETGINVAYQQLQDRQLAQLPCDIDGQLADDSSYATHIAYYSMYPPAVGATPIACGALGPASAPAAALITSTATPSTAYSGAGALGTRKAESLVKMTTAPSASNGFDQAVFSDADVTTTNSVTINGDGGLNGGLYTNGDFSCNSNSTFQGSVVTQGTAYVTNSCDIKGDLWAEGDVKGDSHPKIEGMLKSSTGKATLQSSVDILGGVSVAGTCCSGTLGKTTDGKNATSYWSPVAYGVTGMAAPPHVEMPRVTYTPSDWPGFTAPASWSSQIYPFLKNSSHSTCTDLGNWSVTSGTINLPSTPTVLDALGDCGSAGISVQSVTINVYADTAIFADRFELQSLTFQSGDGAPHNLWLIVPWTNGSATCETSGVDSTVGGSGQVSFNLNSGVDFNNLSTLIYTPGGLDGSNTIKIKGKVYACDYGGSSGELRNSLELTFDKNLGVPGVVSTAPTTYNVDVVYEREIG